MADAAPDPARGPDPVHRAAAVILAVWALNVAVGYAFTLTQPGGAMGVLVLPLAVGLFALMAVPAYRLWSGRPGGSAGRAAGALLLGFGVLSAWSIIDGTFRPMTDPPVLDIALIAALSLSGVFVLFVLIARPCSPR